MPPAPYWVYGSGHPAFIEYPIFSLMDAIGNRNYLVVRTIRQNHCYLFVHPDLSLFMVLIFPYHSLRFATEYCIVWVTCALSVFLYLTRFPSFGSILAKNYSGTPNDHRQSQWLRWRHCPAHTQVPSLLLAIKHLVCVLAFPPPWVCANASGSFSLKGLKCFQVLSDR